MTLLPNFARPATLSKLFSSALDGLFPHYCYLCGLRSYRHVPLCTGCQSDLPANNQHCTQCALPLFQQRSDWETHPVLCGRCLQAPPEFDRVIAPWLYDEQIAFLLHQWKFYNERRLTPLLAHLWLSQLNFNVEPPDLIVPVPLHWSKQWHRGFNQSVLLGIELRRQCPGLKHAKLGLRQVQRHRATCAQSGLSATARRSNLRGAFTARQRCDNLRIAIVDDVLTTGATATAMATTLRDAGASHVEIWCLARTPEPLH